MVDFKNGPLAFGAIAAIIAVVLSRNTPPADTKKEQSGSTQSAAQQSNPPVKTAEAPAPVQSGAATCKRWCEPLRLSEEFFSIRPSGSGSVERIVATAGTLDYDLEVLIALIPDPVDSGLAYRTDEALVAIQRGFAESGYLLDRRWLPWEGEAAKSREYRKNPGVLLFRKPADDKRGSVLTLVLLVGETPKSGLHKTAFNEALDFVRELHRTTNIQGHVRILGPSFSGTAESLRISLKTWIDQQDSAKPDTSPPPEELEGTAVLEEQRVSTPGDMESLQLSIRLRMDRKKKTPKESELTKPGPCADKKSTERLQFLVLTGSATAPGLEKSFEDQFGEDVLLKRTILDDDELTQEAYKYLKNTMGWDFKQVAVLSESDTSYGQEGARESGGSGGQSADKAPPVPSRVVRFPSHVSRIRTAREKEGLRQKDTDEEKPSELSRRNLDLSLAEEHQEPVDIVPQLSPLSTASEDLALSNQLEALCREGIRYVGILATDVKDRLFLAEHVRSHCPDVVLFTLDNHVLDEHPGFTRSMEGSLVLTSFPLYVPTGEGYHPGGAYVQNVSELQEGILLAVRQFLTGIEVQPSAWVVVVGKRDLWPLASLDQQSAHPAIAGSRWTLKWIGVSLVIGLLAFWLLISARPARIFGAWGWRSPVGYPSGQPFLLLGLGTLILASSVLLVFYSLPLRPQEDFPGFGWGVNLLALVAVHVWLFVTCARQLQPVGDRINRPAMVLWGAGALLLPIAIWLLALGFGDLPGGADFFYSRASDFASGLSPLVSLSCLLASFFSLALLELKRRRLSLMQGMAWPLSKSPEISKEPLATSSLLARRLDGFLWEWAPSRWFRIALASILLLSARRLLPITPIAEPEFYGWIFLLLVLLGAILGVLSFWRFFVVWRKLDNILNLVCNTWLLGAFERNSSFFDWKPLRSFGWRIPRHKMSLLSVEMLKTLTRGGIRKAKGGALILDGALDEMLGEMIQAEKEDALKEIRVRHILLHWFSESAGVLERARPYGPLAEEIEKHLALRVVVWVRYVFAHLRYSLISALACGMFVLVGVSTYAFQPKRFLSFGIWAFLLTGSLLALHVFVRMDRNVVLSAIGGTTAGTVSFDRTFFSNLLTYGGIPVLGVVLTQFPAVGILLGDWFQPLLRLFGGG